uniref:hypothetical protein n=1 Tax=Segatella hominis TaxID=2518605 RepID=UPI004038E67E
NIPCANLPTAHPIIYTFHTICKKKKIYHIAFSSSRRKYHTPYPLLFFPGQAKISPWARRKKIHGQTAKNKSAIKPHSNKGKKLSFKEKKLPSHSKIVHTNRTLKDSIKKEQIFHYLYRFI